MVKINKKGDALSIAAIFILVIVSLAIAIILFIQFGFWEGLVNIICTTLTTMGSFLRGMSIDFLYDAMWIIIGLFGILLLAYGKLCRNPIGAIVCTAIWLSFMLVLTTSFTAIVSNIPLISCENPAISMGSFDADGTVFSTVSSEAFMKEVADRTVDCWTMYGAGRFRRVLQGRTPPNPRTCFTINFALEDPVTIKKIDQFLVEREYGTGIPCSEVEEKCFSIYAHDSYVSVNDLPDTIGGAYGKPRVIRYDAIGEIIWQYKGSDDTTINSLYVDENENIYAAGSDGVVILEKEGGTIINSFSHVETLTTIVAITPTDVNPINFYVGSTDGKLIRYRQLGQTLTSKEWNVGSQINSIKLDNDFIYVATGSSTQQGKVYRTNIPCLDNDENDFNDCSTQEYGGWIFESGNNIFEDIEIYSDSRIYAATRKPQDTQDNEGKIYRINQEGEDFEIYRTDSNFYSITLNENEEIFAISSKDVHKITKDGSEVWSLEYGYGQGDISLCPHNLHFHFTAKYLVGISRISDAEFVTSFEIDIEDVSSPMASSIVSGLEGRTHQICEDRVCHSYMDELGYIPSQFSPLITHTTRPIRQYQSENPVTTTEPFYSDMDVSRGRIFIKFFNQYKSSRQLDRAEPSDLDCYTGSDLETMQHHHIFWCFDESVTHWQ